MHRSHSQTGGRNILLSALGGGEGRGEVGEPPSRTAELPTSPSRRSHAGPLPLPPQAGGEGQGLAIKPYRPNMWACPSRRPGREGSPWTAGPAGNSGGRGADVPICGATPLTLPRFRRGPLPPPRKRSERGFSAGNSLP